jgi:UDP-N-acetylglucosamine 2-epimerase (non-hydrolysing)
MKVLSVVGARPQFVKLGPVAKCLTACRDIEHVIVHTGQHYDAIMSDAFFEDLEIPKPNINLGVGSASHGVQTGAMLSALDLVLAEHKPDWTLVYGDTNSTLAAAVAAVKLHLPVAHLEAGLRSFNRRMPEEHNRVLTDHAADLLLAPTVEAMRHLKEEGLEARAVNVGDVMTDVCLNTRDAVKATLTPSPPGIDPGTPYLLATIHRAENTDDGSRLRKIIGALRNLRYPVLLVAHPRLVAKAGRHGIELKGGSLRISGPLRYKQMIRATMGAVGVVTDSGGLQKEAFLLEIPCTTLRRETEWVETLENGWNILDPEIDLIGEIGARSKPEKVQSQPFGDGGAAARVVEALRSSGSAANSGV